ncbi:FtsW/RodA/SpoVE family cell cycle protein [Isoptericola chiayiensis]|uniref:FtsW/RodA/SpoVE family cell cycle protein n=1 Tax=Isoptericola chiayiensis TaxID=579446 RepID=A0ABP8YJ69_9MICO|nr:cell division protein FtsW (lipid II flippase) [Isoptericola chiayiensis]
MSADTPAVTPRQRRPLRLAEIFLLILALGGGVGGYAMVGLSIRGELPESFWWRAGLLGLTALVAHVVLRLRAPWSDQVILPAVVLLNGIGLSMIWRLEISDSAGMAPADAAGNMSASLLGAVVAFTLLWILRDHRWLRRYTYIAMLVGLLLVALPLIPGLGEEINGARIWISVGGFSLQPAEFAKIAFAVFFAGYLVVNRDTLALAGPKVLGLHLPRLRDLGPILVVWAASLVVLVFQRDLGTSLLFFGLFVAMLYQATARSSWILLGLSLFAVGALAAARLFPHVQARVDVWLHPFDAEYYDREIGGSFQLVQGQFSMANGGLFGTGWGEGRPFQIPYAYSDFIYAALGEELGLTGLAAILLTYLLIVQRGLKTAVTVRDGFGKLLAGGLAFVMALQIFVVVGGITRIIPLTGLTLPFMAQGGSSLLANWIVVALLLRISDQARRPSDLPVRGQVSPGRAEPEPVLVGAGSDGGTSDGAASGPRSGPSGTPAAGTPAAGTPASGSPLPRRRVADRDVPDGGTGPASSAPTERLDHPDDQPGGEHR